MKKLIFTIALAGIAGTTLTLQSCNKLKEEILKNIDPFTHSQSGITFTIPAQPAINPVEIVLPDETTTINISQIIKDNSGLDVGIDDFSTIRLQKAELKLTNGDDANNWTNIEYAIAEANTDKGIAAGKPWITGRIDIPNESSEKFSDKTLVFATENLKEYVNGTGETKVYYRYKIKPRAATYIDLNVEATVHYEFKP